MRSNLHLVIKVRISGKRSWSEHPVNAGKLSRNVWRRKTLIWECHWNLRSVFVQQEWELSYAHVFKHRVDLLWGQCGKDKAFYVSSKHALWQRSKNNPDLHTQYYTLTTDNNATPMVTWVKQWGILCGRRLNKGKLHREDRQALTQSRSTSWLFLPKATMCLNIFRRKTGMLQSVTVQRLVNSRWSATKQPNPCFCFQS